VNLLTSLACENDTFYWLEFIFDIQFLTVFELDVLINLIFRYFVVPKNVLRVAEPCHGHELILIGFLSSVSKFKSQPVVQPLGEAGPHALLVSTRLIYPVDLGLV